MVHLPLCRPHLSLTGRDLLKPGYDCLYLAPALDSCPPTPGSGPCFPTFLRPPSLAGPVRLGRLQQGSRLSPPLPRPRTWVVGDQAAAVRAKARIPQSKLKLSLGDAVLAVCFRSAHLRVSLPWVVGPAPCARTTGSPTPQGARCEAATIPGCVGPWRLFCREDRVSTYESLRGSTTGPATSHATA